MNDQEKLSALVAEHTKAWDALQAQWKVLYASVDDILLPNGKDYQPGFDYDCVGHDAVELVQLHRAFQEVSDRLTKHLGVMQ